MSIYNLTILELKDYLINNNFKKYNSIQIYEWLYKKRIKKFSEITNIKKETIASLDKDFKINDLKILKKETTKDVYKYLFELEDKNIIETVLMKQSYGNSICISTQIGCNIGCQFCESGKLKKIRDLEPSEMVLQILKIEEDLKIRISHVVLMGIGEPFDNYNNVMKFIKIINHPKGINIGARHITISTSGLVPKIKQFAQENIQVNLALSLHAPNNELRNKLMPINKVYPIERLMESLKYYFKKTNRRITIEYIMLRDLNDTLECALELSILLKELNCYVNLIPYNATSSSTYKKSLKSQILSFYNILKRNDINVTIRKEFGTKLNAACGQLRAKHKEEL